MDPWYNSQSKSKIDIFTCTSPEKILAAHSYPTTSLTLSYPSDCDFIHTFQPVYVEPSYV